MISKPAADLLDAFSVRIDAFSDRLATLAEDTVPEYAELRDMGEGFYLRESLLRLFANFIGFATQTRTDPDEAFVAQTRQRAYQGVPFEAMLRVWRLANRSFWQELVDIAEEQPGSMSAVVDLWSTYLEFSELTIQASELSHRAAGESRSDLQQLSAAMILENLLSESDEEVIDYMLAKLGVVERDLVVLVASAEIADAARLKLFGLFIPLLSVITTQSGVRPPWTTRDGKFIAIAERANLSGRIGEAAAEIGRANGGVVIGVSQSYLRSRSLADCLDEAMMSLNFSSRRRPIVFFDELSPLELIAHNSTVSFSRLPAWLTIFREGDAKHAYSWSATVDALIKCGGSVTDAAKELFVHPNTVYYRMNSISRACAVDIAKPEHLTSAYLVGLMTKVRSDSAE